MMKIGKIFWRYTIFFTWAITSGCGERDGAGGSGMTTYAALVSSAFASLNAARFDSSVRIFKSATEWRPQNTLTLVNVTGEADSLLVNTEEDYCGFGAWSANSQTGASATEDRSYEAFNLGDPESWTSTGSGIRDTCNGGKVIEVEAYFSYMDLHLSLPGAGFAPDAIVRVAMGEVGSYEAGDVLVKDTDSIYKWVKADNSLVADTEARPVDAYQMDGIKDFEAFMDGGDSEGLTILQAMKMTPTADSLERSATRDTIKAVIDVDFSGAAITASDISSLPAFAKSLDVPFIEQIRDGLSGVSADVYLMTTDEIGGESDPAPTIGNPPE